MLSPSTTSPNHPLLPASLTKLALSHAVGNKLAIRFITIPDNFNGEEQQIADQWLTDTEQAQLDHYTFTKRKREWLSGRICAKQAAIDLMADLGLTESLVGSDFTIISSLSGRPSLDLDHLSARQTDIDISISHSHGMAVGLAGHGRCGIDIQYLSETLFRVKHRFCADSEALILDQLPADELVHLGLLWVAKEAARKCLSGTRIVGFSELRLAYATEINGHYILQFEPEIEGFSFSHSQPISVITHADESFAIGVCTVKKENTYAGTA